MRRRPPVPKLALGAQAMDGKGWKPQYGISPEGVELLGYVEALPREARAELLKEVARKFRSAGYLSLHDDLRAAVEKAGDGGGVEAVEAKVIPLFRRRGRS
jgi:hypothetical protein